jgi:hypothetical protein
MFSAELLVPSSSKYVIAALVNHWFKNQACKMARYENINAQEIGCLHGRQKSVGSLGYSTIRMW